MAAGKPKALIFCIGNPLRSDDGLGWQVAENLLARFSGPEVKIITTHQLLPEHAELVAETKMVIFVDAEYGEPAGEINYRRLNGPTRSDAAPGHDLDIPGLLWVTQRIYGRSPKAHVFSVTGADFSAGEQLSGIVASKLPELEEKVIEVLLK